MEVFTHTALQMLILFTLVLLGAIARKTHLMNDDFDALLSRLVMTITLPGMILNSVLSNTNLPTDREMFTMLGVSFVVYLCTCTLSFVIVRVFYRGVSLPAQGAHTFLIAFGNTGFIGFAVLEAIFGTDAVLYGAIFNIPFNLFMFSVGLLFISSTGTTKQQHARSEQIKRILHQLLSPCLISCFIAIFLALNHITDDGYIGKTCALLGQMTVPASMLIIGSSLAKMPLRDMVNDGWSYLTAALRLIGIPLIIFFIGRLFITDPFILAVVVVLSAMPAASSGTMMCLAYGGDTRAMARDTFLTTILSLATLPFIAFLVV